MDLASSKFEASSRAPISNHAAGLSQCHACGSGFDKQSPSLSSEESIESESPPESLPDRRFLIEMAMHGPDQEHRTLDMEIMAQFSPIVTRNTSTNSTVDSETCVAGKVQFWDSQDPIP